MSTATKLSADWMWEIMQEATDELKKRPSWEIEMLRSAPRMYPSIREAEETRSAASFDSNKGET